MTNYEKMKTEIMENLSISDLRDVYNHGADSGFSGFIYYHETSDFFRRHKSTILEMLSEADDLGYKNKIHMIQHFNCLKNEKLTDDEIGIVLYSDNTYDTSNDLTYIIIENALAWYALETVARAIVEGEVEND